MASDFPWKDAPDVVACNLALGDLVNNLPRRLTVDGRIHAETLLASIGAIAGFAAQRTLFAELSESQDQAATREIHVATIAPGEKYFFGEPLNRTLFPVTQVEANLRLWSLAAGGAIAAGLSAADLPKLEDMFKHVSETLGAEQEGFPSLPEHRPQAPARELLRRFWPLAMMCFNGEFSGAGRNQASLATTGGRSLLPTPLTGSFGTPDPSFCPQKRSLLLWRLRFTPLSSILLWLK